MSRAGIQTPTNTQGDSVSNTTATSHINNPLLVGYNSNGALTKGKMAMSPYNKSDSVGHSVYITDVSLHGGPKDHLIVLSHSTKNMTQIKRWFECIWQRNIVVIQKHICYLDSGCR